MMEKVLEERRFSRRAGDRIEVRIGNRVVEADSCRLFWNWRPMKSGHTKMDLGDRRMTGFVAGRQLAPRRTGSMRTRMASAYDFFLAVRPKKRAPGDPEWMELQCRVSNRGNELWSFVALAEVNRVRPQQEGPINTKNNINNVKNKA